MFLLWWKIFLQASPEIPVTYVMNSSSVQADHINRVTNYFFLAAGFILLVVTSLTAYVLYKFRESKQAIETTKTLSKKWEFLTIGVPVLLVGVFLYLNISTIQTVEPEVNGRTPDVVITGHQWWWEAAYPGDVTTANEIHLPAGRSLLLKLLSADVIHDWWIPQFGNKKDMVPGQVTYLWLNIKKPGEYWGICSEFCGAQHAHMRVKVIAQTDADYQQWLQLRRQASVASSSPGAQLFMQKTCGNCHRIKGTEARGSTGPDLTHLGSRHTILAGMLVNNEENLEHWIRHPQKVKPGAYMPDFKLDDTTVKQIAAYLYSLK